MKCPECGSAWMSGASSCLYCGHHLEAAGERKETLNTERLRILLADKLAAVTAAVCRRADKPLALMAASIKKIREFCLKN